MMVMQAVDGDRPLVSPLVVGSRYDVHGTAMGRAYLVSCSRGERERIISQLVQNTRCSAENLQVELQEAQASYNDVGYCTSLHGWRQGVHAVAVPIYLRSLGRRVVLSCGGRADRLTRSCITTHVAPLLLR